MCTVNLIDKQYSCANSMLYNHVYVNAFYFILTKLATSNNLVFSFFLDV